MKLKLALLVIGLSIFNIAIGAIMSKKEAVILQTKYNDEQRNLASHDFYAFLDASQLTIKRGNLSETVVFTVTLINASTGEILFKNVLRESTYSVDLSQAPLGEYRIEIDTEFISLLGFFTL